MRKLFVVLLALLVCVAMPLMAQEKEMNKKEMPAMPEPPAPLNDDFMNWMQGEWKGWSENAMGKSEDWMKCEMGFGGQFVTIHYKSEGGPMGPYDGGGAMTLDEKGGIIGIWLDSFRDIANGKGTREGNVMTMHWESKMGKYSRTTEKVSDDKLVATDKWEMPDGTVMEGKTELTRVKKMTDKSY